MEITSIKIEPSEDPKCLAFAEVIFDGCFAVPGIRVVRTKSRIAVAMPSRPRWKPCPRCDSRAPTVARFCQSCGVALPWHEGPHWADSCFPITREFRSVIEDVVLREYARMEGIPGPGSARFAYRERVSELAS